MGSPLDKDPDSFDDWELSEEDARLLARLLNIDEDLDDDTAAQFEGASASLEAPGTPPLPDSHTLFDDPQARGRVGVGARGPWARLTRRVRPKRVTP
jgi:hypothetical protein